MYKKNNLASPAEILDQLVILVAQDKILEAAGLAHQAALLFPVATDLLLARDFLQCHDDAREIVIPGISWLKALPQGLSQSSVDGQRLKQLMLSRFGPVVRRLLPRFRPVCYYFPNRMIILSDGRVDLCPYSGGQHSIGTLASSSFYEIYNRLSADLVSEKRDLYDFIPCRACLGSNCNIRYRQGNICGFPLPSLTPSDLDKVQWYKALQDGPLELQVEIASACNYDCCNANQVSRVMRTKIFMDLTDFLDKLDNKILSHLGGLLLYNVGEPLLNKHLPEFLKAIKAKAPHVLIHISTNGMLLNDRFAKAFVKAPLDHIIVSIHGGPGTEGLLRYARRGANYEVVLKNLRHLIALRQSVSQDHLTISLKAILFNWNDSDVMMNQLREDARSLGLSPIHNNFFSNNYCWDLDWDLDCERASRRFNPNGEEIVQLETAGELMNINSIMPRYLATLKERRLTGRLFRLRQLARRNHGHLRSCE